MKYDQFFTPVRIDPINEIDSFSHEFGFIGSCFSDHMFQRFRQHGLGAWMSPFGTTYNPLSIANQLLGSIELSNDFNLFTHSGQSFYWETSHKVISQSPEALKSAVDAMRLGVQKALQQMDTLFITLGSAWAYELNSTGLLVANCHKLPASNFSKRLLEISEITDALHQVITRMSSTTQAKGLGAFDLVSLQKGAQAYKALGLIQRDLSVQDVVSQDLLPAP